jgi:hypothetical protein
MELDASPRRLPPVDRKQAEKIVRRDLPGVIKEMLKGLPIYSSLGPVQKILVQHIYDSSIEAMVANLVDGTIPVGPNGRLTAQLVESSGTFALNLKDSAGNITDLPRA